MQSLLLLGCGGHARFTVSLAKACGERIKGFIDTSNSFNAAEVICGVSVIEALPNIGRFKSEGYSRIAVAVGDNKSRRWFYDLLVEQDFDVISLVHPTSVVDESVIMGKGVIVGPNAVIGVGVAIGNNVIINTSAVIEHESQIGSHSHIAPGAVVCGRVSLGEEVLLGANSTVMPRLSIANKVNIGAGATVVRSHGIEASTLVGCPAKKVER